MNTTPTMTAEAIAVERFDNDGFGGMYQDDRHGDFVRYADFASLAARCEALEADAARYVWLRKFSENGCGGNPGRPTLIWAGDYSEGWLARLDAAIDRARGMQEDEHV
jgi:hypothetical protein